MRRRRGGRGGGSLTFRFKRFQYLCITHANQKWCLYVPGECYVIVQRSLGEGAVLAKWKKDVIVKRLKEDIRDCRSCRAGTILMLKQSIWQLLKQNAHFLHKKIDIK